MDYSFSSSIFVSGVFLLLVLKVWFKSHGSRKQPPGPPGWPLLGNMFDLGTIPHQAMYELGFKHGPVLWLRLGSMNTMVVQSAKTAAELFKNNDSVFCDRKNLHVFTAHDYYKGSLVVGHYGPYWRLIRRICSTELMSNKRINESASVRKKCIDNTIRFIEDAVRSAKARGETGEVNMTHFFFLLNFNVIGNLTFSKDLLDPECKEGHEFYEAMHNFMSWGGKPNLADFFPFLRHFDLQKLKKNMEKDMGIAMEIVTGFVKERLEENKLGKERVGDFLDVLLEHEGDDSQESKKMTYSQIIILTLEMFLAGSETTSTVMEWLMAELLRNPEAMRKLKKELDQVIGPSREVQESDIDKLPYLQAVVKETLRLHPAGPLLIPRNTIRDTDFMGYFIPKDTQVLVNAWGIGRDEQVWDSPLLFKPERFIGSNIDYKGQHFELIPFGAGRRICVGLSLAQKFLHYAIASLFHHFEWELGSNCTSETLDMNEKPGITARKLVPLKAIPKRRLQVGFRE